MFLILILIFALIISLAAVITLYIRLRNNSQAIEQKQQQKITLLKMEAIRARMTPHFLFNALSALSSESTETAEIRLKIKTVMSLLRQAVDNTEKLAIPLSEELKLTQNYIDLQKLHIPEPFIVIVDIEPGTNMNQPVPTMILQIPVENAIKHGLLPLSGEKRLTIRIVKYETGLKLSVEDNGSGYRNSPDRTMGVGTGLKILYQTVALLNLKNHDKIEFSVTDQSSQGIPGQGTVVKIRVPDNYNFEI